MRSLYSQCVNYVPFTNFDAIVNKKNVFDVRREHIVSDKFHKSQSENDDLLKTCTFFHFQPRIWSRTPTNAVFLRIIKSNVFYMDFVWQQKYIFDRAISRKGNSNNNKYEHILFYHCSIAKAIENVATHSKLRWDSLFFFVCEFCWLRLLEWRWFCGLNGFYVYHSLFHTQQPNWFGFGFPLSYRNKLNCG